MARTFSSQRYKGFDRTPLPVTALAEDYEDGSATPLHQHPNGQLIQPVGNALGLSSQLGQNLGTIYQPDREVAMYTRWEMSVQQELPHGMVVAVTYLGSRGRNLPVVQAITRARTRSG